MINQSASGLHVREKLLTLGPQSLSDVELLAVLISSGNRKKSCMHLAHDLISNFGDLRRMLNSDLHSFQQVYGLGMVRYVQLQAAREICRRGDWIHLQKNVKLTNIMQASTFFKRQLRDKRNETIAAIFLDSEQHVLFYEELFQGSITTSAIHPRPIVERTLKVNASAVILAHNHPSGNCEASREDRVATERLREALRLVDTDLVDHLIVGDNEVYSIVQNTSWLCH